MPYFETRDGAKIYFEEQGTGQPLVLIHGWTCSTVFWQRNAPELAKNFRVVTMDLRGHGNSAKILHGHTVAQYARDVGELLEHLDLQDTTLVGWSLAGPVVLSYWQQFAHHNRLRAIGLVDITTAPFSPSDWNCHSLKNHNLPAMHATFASFLGNPTAFAAAFAHRMFKNERASESDVQWIVGELAKTPPWIAIAVYSDYLLSDTTHILPTVSVPVIVFAGNSGVFKTGIDQGRYLAGLAPKSRLIPFEEAGHMLFYEQPEKFNAALASFVQSGLPR